MLYRRSRSSRPPAAKPTPRQQVQTIAVFAPIDEAELLEAVLCAVPEADITTQGKRSTPRQVVDDAYAMYLKAWEFVRRRDPASLTSLRGCSRDLLILAARQAILLDDLITRQESDAKEQADAQQKARVQLQAIFEKASKLRDQARRLFGKIVGTDSEARAEATCAAMAEESGGSVVDALDQLSQFGAKLLTDDDPTRRQCVRLYGLDEGYLQLLASAKEELNKCEADFEALAEAGKPDDQIHWCAGVNLVLMAQIIEAFLSANELDSNVPFLRPMHHEHLVRRISRLPPPPLPRGLAKKPPTAAAGGTGMGARPVPSGQTSITRQVPLPAQPPAPRIREKEDLPTTDGQLPPGSPAPGSNFKGRLGRR